MTTKSLKLFIALLAFVSAPLLAAEGPAQPLEWPAQAKTGRFNAFAETMLDGTWEGTLVMRLPVAQTHRQKPADLSDWKIRVQLEGPKARVLLDEKGEWIEAMPGLFRALNVFSNAVVVGAHGDGPAADGWIETWSINLSSLDEDTVLAEWTRAVTNLNPSDNGYPAFSMAAQGRLKRVK